MTDRLALIKARHAEAGGGGGDADKEYLIAEVENLRNELRRYEILSDKYRDAAILAHDALDRIDRELKHTRGYLCTAICDVRAKMPAFIEARP